MSRSVKRILSFVMALAVVLALFPTASAVLAEKDYGLSWFSYATKNDSATFPLVKNVLMNELPENQYAEASATAVTWPAVQPEADAGTRGGSTAASAESSGADISIGTNYPLNIPKQDGGAVRWMYMRFDLTPYTDPIVSAKLTFKNKMQYQTGTGLPTADMPTRVPYGIIEAYPVSETVTYNATNVAWVEGTGKFWGVQPTDAATVPYLTNNLKPAITDERIATVSRIPFSASTYTTSVIDITSYLVARKTVGATTATVMLRLPLYIFSSTLDSNTVSVDIPTKENTSSSGTLKPSLVVTTDANATSISKNNNADLSYFTSGTIGTTSELNIKFNQFDPATTAEQTFQVKTTDLPLTFNTYAADANATISIDGGAASTGLATRTFTASDFEFVGSDKVKTFTIVTTAQDGTTTKTYNIKFLLPKSNSTKLATLNYTATNIPNAGPVGPWSINDSTGTYNVVLPEGNTSATLNAASAEFGTVTYGDGSPTTAVPGSKVITVTAQDGTTTATYTVNFTVEATSKTIVNLAKRNSAAKGTLTVGTNLQLTATDNTGLEQAYCDRTNVAYLSSTSSIFKGADYIRTAKDDSDATSGPPSYWGSANLDWLSFQVQSDATIYYASPITTKWQNGLDRGWTKITGLTIAANGNRTNIYSKNAAAGESVVIPNLGGSLASGPYNTGVVLVAWKVPAQLIGGLSLNTPSNLSQTYGKTQAVSFTATTTPTTNVDLSTIQWYVNDQLQLGAGAGFTYTPSTIGTYVVSVKVSDNPSAIVDTKTIVVSPDLTKTPDVLANDTDNTVIRLSLETMEYAISPDGGVSYSNYTTDPLPSLGGSKIVKIRFKAQGEFPAGADAFLTFTPNEGDISGDGIIDIADVIMTAEIAVGYPNYDAGQKERANVSDKTDAAVDIADVVMIAERAVGSVAPFPAEQSGTAVESVVVPIKDGAKSIVTIVHDDGDLSTVGFMDSEFETYNLRGTVGMISSRLNQSNLATWQGYINSGRFDIASHSTTHTYWGQTDAELNGMMTTEIVGSQTDLRAAFPGQKVECFVKPGVTAPAGLPQISPDAWTMIRSNYEAMRNTGGGMNSLQPDDWHNLKSTWAADNQGAGTGIGLLDAVDTASAQNGWTIFLFHNIRAEVPASTDTLTMSQPNAHTLFAGLGQRASEGEVWNAFFWEAVRYLKESACATSSAEMLSNGEIFVRVSDTKDDTLFDYPLTIKVNVPDDWTRADIIKNGEVTSVTSTLEGAKRYVLVNVIPDVEIATVKKYDETALLTDIQVDGVSINGFDPLVTTYKVEVQEGQTTDPVVSAVCTEGKTVEITQPILTNRAGTATIVVTSQATHRSLTYTISFIPAPPKQVILLKFDDMREGAAVRSAIGRATDYLNSKGLKSSVGVIGVSLEDNGSKSDYYNQLSDMNATGNIEIWNHGYWHDGGTHTEFKGGTYDEQFTQLSSTNELLYNKCGIVTHTFGASYNNSDATTVTALNQFENIKASYFPSVATDGLNLTKAGTFEQSGTVDGTWKTWLDYNAFVAAYESQKEEPYLVMQTHPLMWASDDAQFQVFKAQIDYLLSQGAVFMTPYEYYNQLNANSTISLERVQYDQYAQVVNNAVEVTITLNGNNFVSVTNGALILAENTDYIKNGNTITISEAYLDKCLTGKNKLHFNFSSGKYALLEVDVVNTDPNAVQPGTVSGIKWKGAATTTGTVAAVPSLGAPAVNLYDAGKTAEQMVTDVKNYSINKLNNNAYAIYSNRLMEANAWDTSLNGAFGYNMKFLVSEQNPSMFLGKNVTRLFKPDRDFTIPGDEGIDKAKIYEFDISKSATVYITSSNPSTYIAAQSGWTAVSGNQYKLYAPNYASVTYNSATYYVPNGTVTPFFTAKGDAYYKHYNAGTHVEIPAWSAESSYITSGGISVFILWDECNTAESRMFGINVDGQPVDNFSSIVTSYDVPTNGTVVPQISVSATAGANVSIAQATAVPGSAVIHATIEGVAKTYTVNFTDLNAIVPGTVSNIKWKGAAATTSNVSAIPSVGAPVVNLYDAGKTAEQMVADAQNYSVNKLNSNAYAMYSNRLIESTGWNTVLSGAYGYNIKFLVSSQTPSMFINPSVTRLLKPDRDFTIPGDESADKTKIYEFDISKSATVYVTTSHASDYITAQTGWTHVYGDQYKLYSPNFTAVTYNSSTYHIPNGTGTTFFTATGNAYYKHYDAGAHVEIPAWSADSSYIVTGGISVFIIWD